MHTSDVDCTLGNGRTISSMKDPYILIVAGMDEIVTIPPLAKG